MAQLLYFGRLMDTLGRPEETLTLPTSVRDTSALREWLDRDRGLDGALLEKTIRLAVNSEIVADPHPVSDGDEIAFMPPVGGG
ncbi:molybdopterin converting factor subunit 1 [Henriciella mobilis]|uniref:molybdopterin converting factor subunit 1 n=1 Tax=Henriciella mobilis TaxID=2305467 RepID=UPI000E66DA24|nr:molybdopterin converting factor subunit 1 [Henriciella mobilis]RIJ18306.1 molybdopterin converting factor subunit 1 [Henriciella mobilis]RIJ24890.1 molybdopterin converting factor subunit 1 [Henriciella mobilis]